MDDFSPTKRALPSGCIWMEDCIISNNIFSQPENRNLHNAVTNTPNSAVVTYQSSQNCRSSAAF